MKGREDFVTRNEWLVHEYIMRTWSANELFLEGLWHSKRYYLWYAAQKGHPEAQRLIENGSDITINEQMILTKHDASHRCQTFACAIACMRDGSGAAAKYLLESCNVQTDFWLEANILLCSLQTHFRDFPRRAHKIASGIPIGETCFGHSMSDFQLSFLELMSPHVYENHVFTTRVKDVRDDYYRVYNLVSLWKQIKRRVRWNFVMSLELFRKAKLLTNDVLRLLKTLYRPTVMDYQNETFTIYDTHHWKRKI
jgi:hypothetical protein